MSLPEPPMTFSIPTSPSAPLATAKDSPAARSAVTPAVSPG